MFTTYKVPVPAAIYRGLCPLTPHAYQRAIRLGAPFGRKPMAQQGEPPAPPSSIVKTHGYKLQHLQTINFITWKTA